MAKIKDLTGKRFFNLVVLERVENVRRGKVMAPAWRCVCDCGNERVVAGGDIAHNRVRSCGCTISGGRRGRSKHPLFQIYLGMIDRCHNENSKDYHHYGSRGIIVCDAWRASFDRFVADVGERPSKFHSLDRIDNSGGYCPGNIRWATNSQQSINRRNNYFPGERSVDVCVRHGVNPGTFRSRVAKGWAIDDALNPNDLRSAR